jgi:hypothetical protein
VAAEDAPEEKGPRGAKAERDVKAAPEVKVVRVAPAARADGAAAVAVTRGRRSECV